MQLVGSLSALATKISNYNTLVGQMVASPASPTRGDLTATLAAFQALPTTASFNTMLLGIQTDVNAMIPDLDSTKAALVGVQNGICAIVQCAGFPAITFSLDSVRASFDLITVVSGCCAPRWTCAMVDRCVGRRTRTTWCLV